jgi:PHD/YefM family antitoxin component YafN of YafNO toxin-antitoxin module
MSKVTLEKGQEQYIVDANGNKTAVILDIALYEQMLEDIHDLAVVAERRSQQPISLADMKKRLSLNGTLSN